MNIDGAQFWKMRRQANITLFRMKATETEVHQEASVYENLVRVSGACLFVEVKSITHIGESFKMTIATKNQPLSQGGWW